MGKTVVEFDKESRRQLTKTIYRESRRLRVDSEKAPRRLRSYSSFPRDYSSFPRDYSPCYRLYYRRLQPEKKIGGLVAKRGVAEASRGSTPDMLSYPPSDCLDSYDV